MKRRSLGSILINNLNSEIKEKILNSKIPKENLQKFEEEEKREKVAHLTDLRDLDNKNETEVYNTLNRMFKNNQYFMYCGPILININPGPGHDEDYLNLNRWLEQNPVVYENSWKPHLYGFIHYVYKTLVNENKNQAVNMMGQIGSGKTFNLIHSMEYLCHIASFQNRSEEIFEMIHKSIQMIHIVSSIFRQNNMESTSSGMLLKLGFNEEHKIVQFDLDAKILDCTLPFSENGRSFSILHSLITGANKDIKKFLELPERENNLNFFRKFYNSFDYQTKQKFKLNDFEIWTKFHSLLNYFEFTKSEVSELLQILSFILLCNEASIGKKKDIKKDKEEYCINKGISSKKLAKTLNIPEDEFLKRIGFSKDLSEVKNSLISMMKSAYSIFFEYIKLKVKNYSKSFFENLTGLSYSMDGKFNYHSFNNNENSNSCLKYIYFMDIPGEVEDQTLGGLTTNLANECLQLLAGSQYLSIVDILLEEKLNLKFFQPLHSYYVTESLMGKNGIMKFLSMPFTEENFHILNKKTTEKNYFSRTTQFFEDSSSLHSKIMFNFKFSHLDINYNYESLYLETKSLKISPKILKIFEASGNTVIQTVYKDVLCVNKSFFHTTRDALIDLFKPMEGLSPYVIYCLHSNNSHKIFYGEQFVDNKQNWDIPYNLTIDILRNSLAMPILFWEWFGYHEWIRVGSFVDEFLEDFEKIKVNFMKYREKSLSQDKEVAIGNYNPYETANYMLSMLGYEKSHIFGVNHILFKKGALKSIRNLIDRMIANMYNKYTYSNFYVSDFYKKHSNQSGNKRKSKASNDSRVSRPNGSINNSVRSNSITKNNGSLVGKTNLGNASQISYKKPKISQDILTGTNRKTANITKRLTLNMIEKPLNEAINEVEQPLNKAVVQRVSFCMPERRNTMKIQCHLNLIENLPSKESEVKTLFSLPNLPNFQKNDYSIYKYLSNVGPSAEIFIHEESSDEEMTNRHYNTTKEENFNKFRKDHNILIPKSKQFELIKNLLDYTQSRNFKFYDYSDLIPQIKSIQSIFRAYKARTKYKIYRYIVKKLTKVQAYVKGMIIRKKFKKFLYCYNCIVYIQRFYKMRLKTRKRESPQLIRRNSPPKKEEKISRKFQRTHSDIVEDLEEEKYSEILPKNDKQRLVYNTNDNFKIRTNWDLEPEFEKEKILEKLLLDNTLYNKSIETMGKTLIEKSGISDNLKKSISQMKFNIKKNPRLAGKKIEDELIEYGKKQKIKRAEQILNKLKNEELQYNFMPKTNCGTVDLSKYGGNDFIARMEFHKQHHEKKLDEIKSKLPDPDSNLTFKPIISSSAKTMKRNLNDLFYWKHKKQEEMVKKILEKESKENEEIEKSQMQSKINKNSELILQKKQKEFHEKTKAVEEEEEYDLWPVKMQKNYFEK